MASFQLVTVAGAVLLLLLVNGAQSLKCVECGKVFLGNKECTDKLPAPTECTQGQTLCIKGTIKGGDEGTIRMCSPFGSDKFDGECVSRNIPGLGPKELCAYTCDSDGCNGANGAVAHSALVLLLAPLGLVLACLRM